MPVYVYRCRRCDTLMDVFLRSVNAASEPVCATCGSAEMERAVTSFAVSRSEINRLQQLDPKYYKKVDAAMRNTPEADPMRHLQQMTPFGAASDAGPPIEF